MAIPCFNQYRQSADVVGGCPLDTDVILFSDDTIQVFRTWAGLKSCLGVRDPNEFYTIVGQGLPIILDVGAVSYTIPNKCTPNTVKVYIDGNRKYPSECDEVYVGITYNPTNTVVFFYNYNVDNPSENLGLQYGQKIIIDYVISTI
jgi:hypothetical protein